MTRYFQSFFVLFVVLASAQAHALSSARAGGDDSSSGSYRPQPVQSDRNCARYQSAIAKLNASIAREGNRSRIQRLTDSKQRYQQRMRDGGCGRSLR
ncbi:hypothetical protein [Denitromonas halophila]|uniref:DUF1090 family protein n=1 Tax=Denitromonas halophila TaxID=1629404 RepID=A0A557QKF5_9RHOO|nr:hypothetical protein [Denitromonas halophila]TVO53392.1 hypothetical protein FHP91_16595 [Denitromonas halophila]